MWSGFDPDAESHLSSCPEAENLDLVCWLKIPNPAAAKFHTFRSNIKSLDPVHKPMPLIQVFHAFLLSRLLELITIMIMLPLIECLLDKHIYTYRMWLNTKIWFLSVTWKTCSNFWIVVLFAHLFLRLIYVCRLLLSLYLSVYKSTCWVWPSGVGNKIYYLHFHK